VAHGVEFVAVLRVLLLFYRCGLHDNILLGFAGGGSLHIVHFGSIRLVRSLALAGQISLCVVCVQHFEHLVSTALVRGLQ